MASVRVLAPGVSGEDLKREREAKPIRRHVTCSRCGQAGHNAKTCGRLKSSGGGKQVKPATKKAVRAVAAKPVAAPLQALIVAARGVEVAESLLADACEAYVAAHKARG